MHTLAPIRYLVKYDRMAFARVSIVEKIRRSANQRYVLAYVHNHSIHAIPFLYHSHTKINV